MRLIHSTDQIEIKRLYEIHRSVRKVAELMKINRKAVTEALVSINVEIKKNQGGAGEKLTEWQQKAVVKRFKNKGFLKSTDGVDYIFSSFKIRIYAHT